MLYSTHEKNSLISYALTNLLSPSYSKNQEDMTAEEILQQTLLEKRKEALRDSLQICRDIDYPVRCVGSQSVSDCVCV